MTDIEPPTSPESVSQEEAPSKRRFPPLTKAEKWTFPFIVLGALGIGGIGLFMSFDNVREYVAEAGVDHPELVPIAIDIAIPVFSLLYLILIRTDRPLAWPRWLAWGLTYVTIHLNVNSTNNLDAQITHAALPTLWIGITEIIAHIYRVEIGEAKGTRPDPIPVVDWVLAPFATAHLYRYMRLWKIQSHQEGLQKRQQRMRAITALRNSYGRAWRFKAPLDLRSELRLGELTDVKVYEAKQLGDDPTTEQLLKIAISRAGTNTPPAPQILAVPTEPRRELENTEEQTALPVGSRTVEAAPEQDEPYVSASMSSPEASLPIPEPRSEQAEAHILQAQALRVQSPVMSSVPSVESKEERVAREQREEATRTSQKAAAYDAVVQVVVEMHERGEAISGPAIAERPDISVGPRTVQRYLKKMEQEGVLNSTED
ncbi:DUF2637 domain-containing protein [Streptomyces sp. B-S-A8]|uniref:DUF2637 domain-containing protein n=1 Tax=Streptomyces solicavernae TaxID=3043614 RepID=A0ABT6S0A9_9ACTN|nr:DUF2637 domain-containing protein [Streptomyces sp. B-S-A8]MDI3390136.1 DUF2637 domain-containing protein [Streptomyces sp. B-S-A8]